jgi:hypothetical protein
MHYRVRAKAEIVLHYDSHIASFVRCRSYPIPIQNTGHRHTINAMAHMLDTLHCSSVPAKFELRYLMDKSVESVQATCQEINSRLINLGSATLNEVTSHSLELYMSTQFCSSFADIKKNHLDRGSKHLPSLAP